MGLKMKYPGGCPICTNILKYQEDCLKIDKVMAKNPQPSLKYPLPLYIMLLINTDLSTQELILA